VAMEVCARCGLSGLDYYRDAGILSMIKRAVRNYKFLICGMTLEEPRKCIYMTVGSAWRM